MRPFALIKVAAPGAAPAPRWDRDGVGGGSGVPVPAPVSVPAPLLPRSPHGLGAARSRGPGDQGKTLRWRRKVEMLKKKKKKIK